jgi:hypothetical protein
MQYGLTNTLILKQYKIWHQSTECLALEPRYRSQSVKWKPAFSNIIHIIKNEQMIHKVEKQPEDSWV